MKGKCLHFEQWIYENVMYEKKSYTSLEKLTNYYNITNRNKIS